MTAWLPEATAGRPCSWPRRASTSSPRTPMAGTRRSVAHPPPQPRWLEQPRSCGRPTRASNGVIVGRLGRSAAPAGTSRRHRQRTPGPGAGHGRSRHVGGRAARRGRRGGRGTLRRSLRGGRGAHLDRGRCRQQLDDPGQLGRHRARGRRRPGVPCRRGAPATNTNNFAAGTGFNSITISGTGYILSGNSMALGVGNLASTAVGSTNTVSIAMCLRGDRTDHGHQRRTARPRRPSSAAPAA